MTQTLPDSLFAQALAFHEAGHIDEAEPLYLAMLAKVPLHPETLHNLGQLWLARDEPVQALAYFSQALDAAPEEGLFWMSYLEALLCDERYQQAREMLQRGRAQGLAGERVEQLAQALNMAADLPAHDAEIAGYFQRGDDEAMAAHARSVLAMCPGHGFAWKALGVASIRLGHVNEAVQALDAARRRLPSDASVLNNLANPLNSLGRHAEAEHAARQALALLPEYPQAEINLGNALRGQGRLEEAEVCYRRAIKVRALLPEAGNNLSIVLQERGQLAESEACLREVLAYEPDYAPAWNQLGNVLDAQGQSEAAIHAFQQGLQLNPLDAAIYNNLACTLKALGRFDEAEQNFCHALQLAPDDYETLNNFGDLLKDIGRTPEASQMFWKAWRLDKLRPVALSNLLLLSQYADHISPVERRAFAQAFAQQYEKKIVPFIDWAQLNDPDRPLRVGWVSADLRNHSVAYFSLPVMEGLKNQFEQYVYYSCHDHDSIQTRHQQACTVWRHVAEMHDAALVEQIRLDQIDILIDLSGHTARNRLLSFAQGAAPVQVTWLGYPDTTGLHNMHWRFTDWHGDPEGADKMYSERLWRLPDVFCCYRPMLRAPEKRDLAQYAVQPTPALTEGNITFGCCNNVTKLTPGVIRLWARVLHAVPGSRLLLELAGIKNHALRDKLLMCFASHQVDLKRVVLRERDAARQYLIYHEVDIALDPFPANGGASSCDALWMGVPLVSLSGHYFASRMGTSLLYAVGHSEWLANDEDHYVQIASELAGNVSKLNALRLGLRAEMEASPLMNEPEFCRHFAVALRGMWQQACAERMGNI